MLRPLRDRCGVSAADTPRAEWPRHQPPPLCPRWQAPGRGPVHPDPTRQSGHDSCLPRPASLGVHCDPLPRGECPPMGGTLNTSLFGERHGDGPGCAAPGISLPAPALSAHTIPSLQTPFRPQPVSPFSTTSALEGLGTHMGWETQSLALHPGQVQHQAPRAGGSPRAVFPPTASGLEE